VLGGPGFVAPSERLNFALVGCGGQGMADAGELVAGSENLVALVDVDFEFVDRNIARRAGGRGGRANPGTLTLPEAYGKAKRYADFRKLLDQQKDIDAVVVATPDHTHAVIAKAAMELGKHVYVEKPMAWSVHEARVLRETAKRTKVVTQMGNQGHSSNDARFINEWIQAGIIGPVREVYVWTNRPIWPQGVPRPSQPASAPAGAAAAGPGPRAGQGGGGSGSDWSQRRVNRETAAAMGGEYPVPATLDWDLFLGPAPEVPYHPIYHPFNWRGWVDWGTGALGDMGAHLIDQPYWALGLGFPTSIEATSTPWGTDSNNRPVSFPLATQVVYHFPARGEQPAVRMTWFDGGLMAPRPDAMPDNVPLDRGGGVIFVGEKGVLVHDTYGSNPRFYPESLMEAARKVPQTYERIGSGGRGGALHRMNWSRACKGQGKASTPFEYASMLTETMLLGVVALKTGVGRLIRYDGDAGKVTNIADANQHLQREYRKGWSL
jgi:predicted dehydrogenase